MARHRINCTDRRVGGGERAGKRRRVGNWRVGGGGGAINHHRSLRGGKTINQVRQRSAGVWRACSVRVACVWWARSVRVAFAGRACGGRAQFANRTATSCRIDVNHRNAHPPITHRSGGSARVTIYCTSPDLGADPDPPPPPLHPPPPPPPPHSPVTCV